MTPADVMEVSILKALIQQVPALTVIAIIVYIAGRFWLAHLTHSGEREQKRDEQFATFMRDREATLKAMHDSCHQQQEIAREAIRQCVERASEAMTRNTEATVRMEQYLRQCNGG